MTWTLIKWHKGPVKGLHASGQQGHDPLFTHTQPVFKKQNCQFFLNALLDIL
jgi:hypothetical protein